MKSKSQGASAPKFVLISDSPRATTYTGTRDQLIALGFARPDHFPEGRKRIKCQITYEPGCDGADDFRTKKLKGGCFELLKWHPHHAIGQSENALVHFGITGKRADEYEWNLFTDRGLQPDDELNHAISEAAGDIIDMVEKAEARLKRSRLSLVKSAPASFSALRLASEEVQHG